MPAASTIGTAILYLMPLIASAKETLMRKILGLFLIALVLVLTFGWNGYAQRKKTKVTWQYISVWDREFVRPVITVIHVVVITLPTPARAGRMCQATGRPGN